ncbi:HalOD1 output domain-containing protein [Halorussus litoreus]|uniref:HalOD1 output domain-containing protein n=1 Tax=Halorussus litoreus TaxID=1710536 RepID=UPI000E21D07A|nr:HalOD1 output domain-containing protein [Halorussus litoreus]
MNDTQPTNGTAIDLGTLPPHVAHARFDPELGERPVRAVLDALAEASHRPVEDLDVRLHDAVDPDALDDLFRPTRTGALRNGGHVAFAVGEFEVDVHADGHVFVRRTASD